MKLKLQYEWKNIYRTLNSKDFDTTGTATRKQFEEAL